MANINTAINNIQNATYGEEVRGSIIDGIESINSEVESTTGRQTDLEQDWVTTKENCETATTNANTARDYATTQGNFAKDEGEALVNTINQFNYIGDYDPTINYQPKNMVKYHGSTFVNKVACRDTLPTDATKWQVIATGYVIRGNYDSNSTYEERDLVYYSIEKKFYECISYADVGISPYSTSNWKVVLDVKDMLQEINDYVNDTTSIFCAHDLSVTINHNLNRRPFPVAYTVGGAGYGNGGFGCNIWGGGIPYQVGVKAEYTDDNNAKLYFDEAFNGTPTITSISSTEYQIDFSNDISIIVKLI